jgi:hypothetical protein
VLDELSDAGGARLVASLLPLHAMLSVANAHDSRLFEPLS